MLASSPSLSWTDRPGRELLRLAWPITISMVSFSTMTLASTAFVARVGADELAGVGLAGVVGVASRRRVRGAIPRDPLARRAARADLRVAPRGELRRR